MPLPPAMVIGATQISISVKETPAQDEAEYNLFHTRLGDSHREILVTTCSTSTESIIVNVQIDRGLEFISTTYRKEILRP